MRCIICANDEPLRFGRAADEVRPPKCIAILAANGIVYIREDLRALVGQCAPLLWVAYLAAHLNAESDRCACYIDVNYWQFASGSEGPSLALRQVDLVVALAFAGGSEVYAAVPPFTVIIR